MNAATLKWKLFHHPAPQSMNMQQQITRSADAVVVAEFAIWPNCNHGKCPQPCHILMEANCSSTVGLPALWHHHINIQTLFFKLTTQLFVIPETRPICRCGTWLLEVIHFPTCCLPCLNVLLLHLSAPQWVREFAVKGVEITQHGTTLEQPMSFYHLYCNSLDMSGKQWPAFCMLSSACSPVVHVIPPTSQTDCATCLGLPGVWLKGGLENECSIFLTLCCCKIFQKQTKAFAVLKS